MLFPEFLYIFWNCFGAQIKSSLSAIFWSFGMTRIFPDQFRTSRNFPDLSGKFRTKHSGDRAHWRHAATSSAPMPPCRCPPGGQRAATTTSPAPHSPPLPIPPRIAPDRGAISSLPELLHRRRLPSSSPASRTTPRKSKLTGSSSVPSSTPPGQGIEAGGRGSPSPTDSSRASAGVVEHHRVAVRPPQPPPTTPARSG